MARRKDKDIDVIPNVLGLMYFNEKTNSKITIDGDTFKKVVIGVAITLFLLFSIYPKIL